jgi:hypothetical protein
MPAQLEHLARAYFHQDWELDSESAVAVVDTFVTDEDPAAAAELISEIDHMLASQLTDDELHDLWIKTLGASLDPYDSGQTMRDWLTVLRARLLERATT